MDSWITIVTSLVALLTAVLLPLLFRRSRKQQAGRSAELLGHLRSLGVDVSPAQAGDARERIGLGYASGQKSEGLIDVADRTIDSANVISITSQYGTRYFIDYHVKSPNILGERELKKTVLTRQRDRPVVGRVTGIRWKGDPSLTQSLSFDYSLEDRLLTAGGKVATGRVGIFPERRFGYTRIRTDYSLPPAEVFQALCSIARHIRAW